MRKYTNIDGNYFMNSEIDHVLADPLFCCITVVTKGHSGQIYFGDLISFSSALVKLRSVTSKGEVKQ